MNLLFHLARPMQRVNHLLGAFKHLLLILCIINLLRLLHHELLLRHSHHLPRLHLKHLRTVLKRAPIPIFKPNQQLLLKHIDLLLRIMMVLLVDLQLAEHIPILLLQIFHLPEHHKLLLVYDILRLITHLIISPDLFSLETVATFMLLSIELTLQMIDLLLGLVQVVSDTLDVDATLLCHLSEVQNVLIEALTLFSLLILYKGLLLVDCSAFRLVRMSLLGADIDVFRLLIVFLVFSCIVILLFLL